MSLQIKISSRFCGLALPLLCCVFFNACYPSASSKTKSRLADFPAKVLWAWERPENLEFLDSKQFAVAFLAQTLEMKSGEVIFRPRLQPLKVSPAAKLIAVTRIEIDKQNGAPALSDNQLGELVNLILKTLERKNVGAIQIDFDAAVSQRDFYRRLLTDLRSRLPSEAPLSITALASACVGDRWMENLPIDEAVPMAFRMGADAAEVRRFLRDGNDWREPLCRAAYGISIDEPVEIRYQPNRRLYVFNPRSWKPADLEKLPKEF